jgi:DNA-binding transcriptional regulator YiaG
MGNFTQEFAAIVQDEAQDLGSPSRDDIAKALTKSSQIAVYISHGVDPGTRGVNRQAPTSRGKVRSVNAVTEQTNVIVGNAIRYAREHQGVSGNELARRTGISRPRLREYERGSVRPGDDKLEAIARALDYPDPTDIGWFYRRHPSLEDDAA